MIKFILITNVPEVASFGSESGAGRIMVDLEINGKEKRQGNLNTLISRHRMADVEKIRRAAPASDLIVRLNPLHEDTKKEADEVIESGADFLMLPMFTSPYEIREFSSIVGGRAGVIPLVETPQAFARLPEIVKAEGIDEIYIGLNDLHLGLGLSFMFEPLAFGLVDYMAGIIKGAGLPFGFGGVARIGEGMIPGEYVLGEHARLGSTSVILSRTFHGASTTIEDLKGKVDLPYEIKRLKSEYRRLLTRGDEEAASDRERVVRAVLGIIEGKLRKVNA